METLPDQISPTTKKIHKSPPYIPWIPFILSFLTFAILMILLGLALAKFLAMKKTSISLDNSPFPTSSIQNALPSPSPDLYTEQSRSATANWKTYTFKTYGFSLRLPPDWIPDSEEFGPTLLGQRRYVERLRLPKPLTPDEEKDFHDNTISVSVVKSGSPLGGGKSLLYQEKVISPDTSLIFQASNENLRTYFSQILSTFKFL